MLYFQFLIGFTMYSILAYASYSEGIKQSKWFYLLGTACAIVSNLTWLWISKNEMDTSKLLIKGLYWDSMLTAIYILVPLLVFKATLTNYQFLGLATIVLGLFLVKL